MIKVLVLSVLSKPASLGLIPESQLRSGFNQAESQVKINFKVIASLVYYAVMEFLEQLLNTHTETDLY